VQRFYTSIIQQQLRDHRKMIFICGPRQVGKTTIAKAIAQTYARSLYLNWDYPEDRLRITQDYAGIAQELSQPVLGESRSLLILDELHKFKRWKNFIKGFFDKHGDSIDIIVTGSAQLTTFSRTGDSLMGRYFPYTIHPISLGETISDRHVLDDGLYQPCRSDAFHNLLQFGGFPEPFLKVDPRFALQWQNLRHQQLFKEDIRDLAGVRDLQQMELLAMLLSQRVGQLVNYTSLANDIQISNTTVRRWCSVLEATYFCYFLKPWSRNIRRSLVKEPKIYLWDWSLVDNHGARFENCVASHLFKTIMFWNESGMGRFGLFFLRDKDQKEVDFVVTKNNEPWLLIETKKSDIKLSQNLLYFQAQTGAPYGLQVMQNMDYVDLSCFKKHKTIIVPAETFLSQII